MTPFQQRIANKDYQDEYERAYFESPEMAEAQKKMERRFRIDANKQYWESQGASGGDYVALFIAVVVIGLIFYCSL